MTGGSPQSRALPVPVLPADLRWGGVRGLIAASPPLAFSVCISVGSFPFVQGHSDTGPGIHPVPEQPNGSQLSLQRSHFQIRSRRVPWS